MLRSGVQQPGLVGRRSGPSGLPKQKRIVRLVLRQPDARDAAELSPFCKATPAVSLGAA